MTAPQLKFIFICLTLLLPSAAYGQWDIPNTMEAGQNALEYHDYKTAISIFNRVISSRPNSHKAYYYRGIAKQNLGDYTGSENDLSEALSLNPYYYDAYDQRGAVRFLLGKYSLAASDFSQATQFKSNHREIWNNLILSTLKTGDYQRSDSLSDVLIRKWPRNADGYLLKSRSLYGAGQLSSSERLTDRALQEEPFHLASITVKANYLMTAGKWADAIEMYSRALHIHPKNSRILLYRGLCNQMNGTIQESSSDFRLAHDINPADTLVQRCLACTSQEELRGITREIVSSPNFLYPDDLFYISHTTDAEYILNKYDLLPPHYLSDYQKEAYNPPASFTSGYEQLYRHDFLSAISQLSESITENPHIPESYYDRAFAYAKSNNIDKAITDLCIAIAERPSYAEAYYNRGILKLWLNDIDGAKLDFSKAGELGIDMAYKIIQEMN